MKCSFDGLLVQAQYDGMYLFGTVLHSDSVMDSLNKLRKYALTVGLEEEAESFDIVNDSGRGVVYVYLVLSNKKHDASSMRSYFELVKGLLSAAGPFQAPMGVAPRMESKHLH